MIDFSNFLDHSKEKIKLCRKSVVTKPDHILQANPFRYR